MQPPWTSDILEWAKIKLPFLQTEEEIIYRNNLILDFHAAGSEADRQELRELATHFPSHGGLLSKTFDWLTSLSPEKLEKEAGKALRKSIRTIVLMLGGDCNMNCTICATDRKKSPDEIRWPERKEVLDQARAMGARIILTSGWGEPTLDKDFWRVAEYAREHGMDWILVTNGLRIDSSMARRLADYPVILSLKFWSTDPGAFYNMALPRDWAHPRTDGTYPPMSREEFRGHFSEMPLGGMSILVPRSLALAMDFLPRKSVSIQVAVGSDNFDDVVKNILPFADKEKIEAWVEPKAQLGRNEGNHSLDLSSEQKEQLKKRLVGLDPGRRLLNVPVNHEGRMCSLLEMPQNEMDALGIIKEKMRLASRGRVGSLAEMRFRHPTHRKELLEMKWAGGSAKLQSV